MSQFDEQAQDWEKNEERVKMAEAVAAAMLAAVRPGGRSVVLDFGAGTGLVSFRYAGRSKTVYAFDSSAGMLEQISEKASASGVTNVIPVKGDIEAGLSLPEKPDIVVSSMALHHVKDAAAPIKLFYAALKDGGKIALADLEAEDGTFHSSGEGIHHFGFQEDEVFEMLGNAGFGSIRIRRVYEREKNGRVYGIFLATAVKHGRVERAVYTALGNVFTGLGIAGVFLPLLPTTPFLLLAAWCYVKGSNRLYKWLISHRTLGRYIKDFSEGKGVPLRAKVTAIALIWLTIGSAMIFFVDYAPAKIAMAMLAVAVSGYVVFLKTRRGE